MSSDWYANVIVCSPWDFHILNNTQLSHYPTLDHDIVQDWEEDNGNDARGSSGDNRGKVQQEKLHPMDIMRRVDYFAKDRQGIWFKLSENSDGWGRRRQHFSMLYHDSSSDESYTKEQEATCLQQLTNKGRHINQLKTLALDKACDNISQIDMETVSKPIKAVINS